MVINDSCAAMCRLLGKNPLEPLVRAIRM